MKSIKLNKMHKETAFRCGAGLCAAVLIICFVIGAAGCAAVDNGPEERQTDISRTSVDTVDRIEIDSITIEASKTELVIGEQVRMKLTVLPADAEAEITWSSSNPSAATVDANGVVTATGGGSARITAADSSGMSAYCELFVNGNKRLMELNISKKRTDKNHIGDEWSYSYKVNGQLPENEYIITAGDEIEFFAKITEEDERPDIGEASGTYIVSQSDIANGFTVSMNVSVQENGGRNSGQCADFIMTFVFTPVH